MPCLRPHHPELPQLSRKALLYLSCWQPPPLISVKEQHEITHLSGGVGDKATVAASTLWLWSGPAGGGRTLDGNPGVSTTSGTCRGASSVGPQGAGVFSQRSAGPGWARRQSQDPPAASETTAIRRPQQRSWAWGKSPRLPRKIPGLRMRQFQANA